MAVNDLGNGQGYIYIVGLGNTDADILAVKENNPDGVDSVRRIALTGAPLAAPRSAIGTITITNVAAAGNLTAIGINGVDQIAGPVAVTTSNPATEAAAWAAAINAFAPTSGPNYTAYSIGAVIYIVSPRADGSTSNGLAITVSVSVGSIIFTTVDFSGGAPVSGVVDLQTGRYYYLNADAGGVAADPTTIAGADEITELIVNRGLQTGFPTQDKTIASDAIATSDRYSAITIYNVDTEGGAASDVLVFMNPQDFIEGDMVVIEGANTAHAVVVESAPVSGSAAPSKNIYLSGNVPFTINSVSTRLLLLFRYDATLGPIFTEVARANAGTLATITALANVGAGAGLIWRDTVANVANLKSLLAGTGITITNNANDILIKNTIPVSNSLFVSKGGNNTTGTRGDFALHYLTIDAAYAAAQAGDVIIVFPGDYTESTSYGNKAISIHLFAGVTITSASTIIQITAAVNFKLTGNGVLYTTGATRTVWQNNATSELYIECDEIKGDLNIVILRSAGKFVGNIKSKINIGPSPLGVVVNGSGDFYLSCPQIRDFQTTDVRNSASYQNIDIQSVTDGNICIEADIIDGRVGGPTVAISTLPETVNVKVKAKIIGNYYTSAITISTSALQAQRTGSSIDASNVVVEADILCTGSAMGIYARFNDSGVNMGRLIFNGNITTADGEAIRNVSGGYYIDVNGDVLNTSATKNAVVLGVPTGGSDEYPGGILRLNGRVKGAIPPIAMNVVPWYTRALILDSVRIIDGSATNSIITSGASAPVWIYNNAMANVVDDGSVANMITGTAIIVDADVIY